MSFNSRWLTLACVLWCVVTICQALEDCSILEHLNALFDWNAPPRLDDSVEGVATNPSFPSPHPLNHHHQTVEAFSNFNHDGSTQTAHKLANSLSGFSGMSRETLAQVGIEGEGATLSPASQAIAQPERGFPVNHTQQQQYTNWQLPEQTADHNWQLPSIEWLMENSEWLLLNGSSHLSDDDQRQPLPVGDRDFYPSAGSQSATSEARNVPGNHENRRRPLMAWSTPEEDYPQCHGHSTLASAVTHPEHKLTKRLKSSELPIKFSLTHDSFLPSFGSRSFSTLPVVYSKTRKAQTFKSPLLRTRPESGHYSLAPNVDPLSFSHPVIRLEACPVREVSFDEPSIQSGSSSQPATLHHQNSKYPSGDDALTAVGIHHDTASQHQTLLPGPERDIDSSALSDSQTSRIDPTILNFLNSPKIDDHERRKLESELAEVSDLASLEFDTNAFQRNVQNGGMKEWMRIPIIKKIQEGSQKKLRLPPDNRAYVDLAKLVNSGRWTYADSKLFSKTKRERTRCLTEARYVFLKDKAVWSLHWLIHKRIDVQIYLGRLEDSKFLKMEEMFYLFLYYVEMIIAIVPRALQIDGGPINEASELASACDLFVEFTKTLQSQANLVGEHCDSKLADTIRSFKSQQKENRSCQYHCVIWHFLEEWIRRNRKNIIPINRIDVGSNIKSFFNDVFYLTVRNLNKRYQRLLAFQNRFAHVSS